MPRSTKAPVDPDDAPLKRLGGGRWQTRDERFTIEPQSGTWVIVDAEQTDDFGLALVRGPFPSLTAAKEAISTARASAPAASPLADRIERRRGAPASADVGAPRGPARAPRTRKGASGRAGRPEPAEDGEPPATSMAGGTTGRQLAGQPADAATPEEPPEPAWLDDLAAAERGRARRLIARLRAAGVADAEGLVRRDLVGGVPSLAALAIKQRLDRLGPDADPGKVAGLLAEGRDEELGVRWRLVDGDGRPILLDPSARRRR